MCKKCDLLNQKVEHYSRLLLSSLNDHDVVTALLILIQKFQDERDALHRMTGLSW